MLRYEHFLKMFPERRSSSKDGISPVFEQSNVIAAHTTKETNQVLLPSSSLLNPVSNQKPPMNATQNQHYQISLQHQQLQQNNVTLTSVPSNEPSTGHNHTTMSAILTSTYNHHPSTNDSYSSKVVTLSGQPSISATSPATTTMTTNSSGNGSKLLVLHPNQLNESFKASSDAQSVGNIVLVATEPMDFVSTESGNPAKPNNSTKVTIVGNSDEELTPLNWLHDKNLLKGINLTCTQTSAKTSPNSLVATSTTSVGGITSAQQSPSRQSINSPTSDYMDDSYVSEETGTSANSSDQGISIYGSPISGHSEHSTNVSYTVSSHPPTTVVYTTSNLLSHNHNNINNNNSANINRNTRPQQQHQPHLIRLSPGDTVFEYKTANLHSKINAALQSAVVVTTSANEQQQQQHHQHVPQKVVLTNGMPTVSSSSATNIINNSTSSVMHFHKKYLREEQQRAMKQIPVGSSPQKPNTTSAPNGNVIYQPPPFSPTSIASQNHIKEESSQYHHQSPSQLTIQTSPVDLQHHFVDHHPDDYSPNDDSTLALKTQFSRSELSSPDSFVSPAASPNPTPTKHFPANHNHPPSSTTAPSPQKPKHPSNLPYDPLVHTANKPPLSFSSLIFLAIDDSVDKALPVKEIYAWIVSHYPYFKSAPTGWKNSVRHNLSLNKCFQKVEKAPNMGKGSLWRVEQLYKQNLIQALNRSSYHPCSATGEKLSPSGKVSPRSADSPSFKQNPRALDAELFPRLSKYMAEIGGPNGSNTSATLVSPNGSNHLIHHQRSNVLIGRNGGLRTADSPSPPGTPRDDDLFSQHPFGNATTITNNHNNNTIVINNNAAGPEAGCFVSTANGTSIFYNGSAERLVRDWGADSIDDVNAATAMLALKHGPKVYDSCTGYSPVITSSPSEDHTYSAGGLAMNGGVVSNVVTEISAGVKRPANISCSTNHNNIIHNHNSDNNSNGTLSDAAYESSEESQTPRICVTEAELEAQRHAEGVDAFLTFATEVSSMSSPLKRPASVDSQHSGHHYLMENISNNYIIESTIYTASPGATPNSGSGGSAAGSTMSSPTSSSYRNHLHSQLQHHHHHAQYLHHHPYATLTATNGYHLSSSSSPSPPKKPRARTLRTKLKKKTVWLR